MQNSETSMEVKVGALVLFSLVILGAFIFVLGDFTLSDQLRFSVEFENAGGLKPGADVAIAGINVGTVEELRFIRNEEAADREVGVSSAVAVRAKIAVDKKYSDAIRKSSEFYITSRGVLGEKYIEIVTESFESPAVASEDVLRGVDPPRMDIIVAKATKLMTLITDLLDDPDIEATELISNAASLMGNLDEMLVSNRSKIDSTIGNVESASGEASKLVAALNVAVEDGEQVKGIIGDLRRASSDTARITGRIDRRLDPLIDNADATMTSVREASSTARDATEKADALLERNAPKIDETIENVRVSTEELRTTSEDTSKIVRRVESGEGTVGQLLADREIYDDMKELLRIIKQKPWKIIWKD
jgi:phospholipid/cholesterol/gamma-HCH transport system substrate-binding protein